jgi:hypothetical protein
MVKCLWRHGFIFKEGKLEFDLCDCLMRIKLERDPNSLELLNGDIVFEGI